MFFLALKQAYTEPNILINDTSLEVANASQLYTNKR